MTIRFVQQWNGYSPDTIVTLAGAEETRLIGLGYAVTDLDGPGNTPLPVTSTTNLAGEIDYLRRPNGRASGLGVTQKKPRILKRFIDLANVTIAPTTVTVVPSIDKNSPFGGPALKLTITAAATGSVQIDLGNLNMPLFDHPVAASVWVDEANRIASLGMWVSPDAGAFTNSVEYRSTFFGAGDKVGGHRVVWGGTGFGGTITTNGSGFTAGVSTLKSVRLKAVVYAGLDTVLWIKDIFIPAKQRPIVCFTWDDAYASWMTRVKPYLDSTGIKATFGIYSSGINGGAAYVTDADIQTLSAAGHQIACHNVNNYKLQTLSSNTNGEDNGTGTSVDSVGYATEYHTSRQVLEALGVAPGDLCYHPWVQGGSETQAVDLLRAAGVEVARGVGPYQWQPYGFPMGNNAMNLSSWPLSNTKTLAQNKVAIDNAVTYGGLLVFMGHDTADTAADSVTAAEADVAALMAYAISQDCDILTMRQLRDRLATIGALAEPSTNPSPPTRMIGRLLAANFNITTDQAITLPAGSWIITGVYAVKGSINMTTAAGGVYTAASKGGTAVVAAGQVYTGLTGTATDVATLTMAATPTVTLTASGTGLYFALTTGQGAAATGDIFVYGRPA